MDEASEMMGSLLTDLRYAARGLRNNKRFAAAAVAMLALGIGVNTMVFTVTEAVLFKGFPLVERNDRMLYMTTGVGCCASYPDFEDWRAAAQSFAGMAIVHGINKTYRDADGFAETRTVTEISADTFDVTGTRPLLGRDFEPSDEAPGAAPVAILRHDFWTSRYAQDLGIVGRTVLIDGVPTTVIGVMPAGFSFPQNQDAWVPLVPTPEVRQRANRGTWFVFGRLKDGVSEKTARAEFAAITKRLEAVYPDTNEGLTPTVYTFHEFFIGKNATTIYRAMLGAVAFVLLIACANLANLLLAHAVGRAREIAVRIALGAGHWRIVRQLLIESLLLSALGGFCGWWIAKLGVRTFARHASGPTLTDAIGSGGWFDGILDYSMDYGVLAYLVSISIGTGLLFGLAPARRLARLDVNSALKDGGRGASSGARGSRLSGLLVTAEVVLAIVLLGGAGVMVRSFLNIYTADMGVRADGLTINYTSLPADRYPTPESRLTFFDRLAERAAAIPGVDSVAFAGAVPTDRAAPAAYELAGQPAANEQSRPRVPTLIVSPAYFRTVGAPLVAGREFDARDTAGGAPVAIVNRRFAELSWPGEDPLGKRVRLTAGAGPEGWLTVVGVAPNIAQNDRTRQRTEPVLYTPQRQTPAAALWLIMRASVPPAALSSSLREEIGALDPLLPMSLGPYTLADFLANAYQYRGVTGALFAVLACVALVLAAFGLYAVVAHAVGQRTQELGIRMAMGATARDIAKLVLRQGLAALALGLAIGVSVSLAVNRMLAAQLVEVSPGDPLTYGIIVTALVLAAAVGCWLPARRAMRVDPLVALRSD